MDELSSIKEIHVVDIASESTKLSGAKTAQSYDITLTKKQLDNEAQITQQLLEPVKEVTPERLNQIKGTGNTIDLIA